MQNKAQYQKFYNYLYDNGESITSLCRNTGITHTTIKRRFFGDMTFTFGEVAKIKRLYKLTDQQILDFFLYGR